MYRTVTISLLALVVASGASAESVEYEWGLDAGAGYFNFRNSLYADREPDAPAELGDRWTEYYLEPWISGERSLGAVQLFGKVSYTYAATASGAPELSGGDADSAGFDDAYIGLRYGDAERGEWTLAAGRYPFELGHGFLVSDGYADGGSRGGLWSNARKAFAPGAHLAWARGRHRFDAFYLVRDERPESNADTRFRGANYEWTAPGERVVLGASLLEFRTDEFRALLDGARIVNLRAGLRPHENLVVDTEYVREDNGDRLDASAWYVQGAYTFADLAWPLTLEYRYAFFEGDDPDTTANEQYDPLFPGFRDWGTWFQGEIAGGWFLSNSNLRSHMLRTTLEPSEDLRIGIGYFDFAADQPGSFGTGATSRDIAREFDLIVEWSPVDAVSLTFVLANADPGAAIEQAFDRTSNFRYGMFYVGIAL